MNPTATTLYEIRYKFLDFYAKHGKIVDVVFKFISVLLMQMAINNLTGYFSKMTSMPVMLIASLVLSIMPWWIVTFFMGVLIILHMFKVSLLLVGVVIAIFTVMLMIDMIFAPGYSAVIFFVPVAFMLKVPFLLPIVIGLTAPMTAALPMMFGVTVYYILSFVSKAAGLLANASAATASEEAANIMTQLINLVNGIIGNMEMYSVMAAFTVTAVIVYILHRLSVDNSWMIAVIAGTIVDMILILFANASVLAANTATMSVGFVIVSSLISCFFGLAIQFMLFSADYKHTENVQFEDDDYYYYVKAVPKVKVNNKVYDSKVIETPEETVLND